MDSISLHSQGIHPKPTPATVDLEQPESRTSDYELAVSSRRAQWLRAAVLGANDGLLSTASLMIGVGAVKTDRNIMILSGVAGMLAGACSMAMGEFVSVYSQYDIELAQMKRDNKATDATSSDLAVMKKDLPSPFQAAAASGVSFSLGAAVPLLSAAFIDSYLVRLGVVIGSVSIALLGFGGLAAVLGRGPPLKSSLRVLIGGWIAMGITYGLTKLFGLKGL